MQFQLSSGGSIHAVERRSGPFYNRIALLGQNFPLLGQFLRFDDLFLPSMTCDADTRALEVDFRFETTRPDVGRGRHTRRPGFYVSERVDSYIAAGRKGVVFNGNNIGYWGTQFLVINGELVYKKSAPLFYSSTMSLDGEYLFIVQEGSARPEALFLRVTDDSSSANSKYPVQLRLNSDQILSKRCNGISGFPLLLRGRAIWDQFITQAWDPKLLFDVGDPTGLPRPVLVERLLLAQKDGYPLQRHALTILGITQSGSFCVLSVEEHDRTSRGVSLPEAAELLLQLDVQDGIVLGGKGDAQLASTYEGLLIRPLISQHDSNCLRAVNIPTSILSSDGMGVDVAERPVPSIVTISPTAEVRNT